MLNIIMANKGMYGDYFKDSQVQRQEAYNLHTQGNKNCIFIIQSGSMIMRGRTELLAELMFEFATLDNASSADVYTNDDGKVMYLGNISKKHPYLNEPIAIPYGGGEGWTNANILAGFVETYNHTFIFDDGDMMPEMAVAILERVHPDKRDDFNLIHISNHFSQSDRDGHRINRFMDRATELNINNFSEGRITLLPFGTPQTQSMNNRKSWTLITSQFE